jgi:hypothetical protein
MDPALLVGNIIIGLAVVGIVVVFFRYPDQEKRQ